MANDVYSVRGLRRDLAFDRHSAEATIDIDRIVAQGHAKVIRHYRWLLSRAGLTSAERADIEARLARELRSSAVPGGYQFAA